MNVKGKFSACLNRPLNIKSKARVTNDAGYWFVTFWGNLDCYHELGCRRPMDPGRIHGRRLKGEADTCYNPAISWCNSGPEAVQMTE